MDNQSENQEFPKVEVVDHTPTEERFRRHHKKRLFWPFILILIGVILLIQNLSNNTIHLNWWAAFIFIPVLGSLAAGYNAFEKSGKFDAAVRSSLGGVIVVGTVATILLLDMDWSKWWPLMLLATGLSMLINGISIADAERHPLMSQWAGLNLWFGLAVILLGTGFLAKILPIPVINDFLSGYPRWWAVPILIPGVGAFVNATIICARNKFKPNWTVWAFSIIGICFTAVGLFALFTLNWNYLGPIILIAAGIIVLSGILLKK